MTANSKEWVQYGSAVLMVISGVTLTFISFFLKDEVTDGVLWYMAQALTFAGGVFGVNIYFRTKIGESENRIKKYVEEQLHHSNTLTDENNQ